MIGDVAHPLWRARSVGVYRLWRDIGVADGILAAIGVVSSLTALSGLVAAVRMYETRCRPAEP